MAAPSTTVDVSSCACLTLKVTHVNAAEVSTPPRPPPARRSPTARRAKNLASTVPNVSAVASSVTARWTVETGRMNRTVSFHPNL